MGFMSGAESKISRRGGSRLDCAPTDEQALCIHAHGV